MSVEWRCTRIGGALLDSVSLSSVAQFGDNEKTELQSRAIAVQRAVTNYEGDETRFAFYSIFTRPELRLNGCANVRFLSASPGVDLRVNSVRVLAVSASSLVRFGCGKTHRAVARIKHIRQFNDDRDIR